MSWLAHILGLDDASGGFYLFWSGIGADIPIFAAAIAVARKHNCHIHGCWRVGRHRVDQTVHVVCRKHHPDGPLRPHHLFRPQSKGLALRLRNGRSKTVG